MRERDFQNRSATSSVTTPPYEEHLKGEALYFVDRKSIKNAEFLRMSRARARFLSEHVCATEEHADDGGRRHIKQLELHRECGEQLFSFNNLKEKRIYCTRKT